MNKCKILTIAEKCKNILTSNWEANLNTIKADSQGSKQDIYTSKVKYFLKRGKPYIWIPENDLHNVNTVIDERASLAVASPHPGPLANVFRSMKMLPARIALTGEIVQLGEEKVKSASESLREMIVAEQSAVAGSSYAVSSILTSSTFGNASRGENLVELLDSDENFAVYKFITSSCMFIDRNGSNHEVDLDDFEASKADEISTLATKLIDGINQSGVRRRALVILCYSFLNVNAKEAYIQSVDRKGFDVFAKVSSGSPYQWKEYRLTFEEEVRDVESFCCQLVKMEEKALEKVKTAAGLE